MLKMKEMGVARKIEMLQKAGIEEEKRLLQQSS